SPRREALKDMEEADEIGVGVGMRVDQRMTHARLRGEMHDMREALLLEQRRHAGAVSEVELGETERRMPGQFVEPRPPECRIVIGVEIVEADNGAGVGQQTTRDMEADEAGGAGDEDWISRHGRPLMLRPAWLSQAPQLDLGWPGGTIEQRLHVQH